MKFGNGNTVNIPSECDPQHDPDWRSKVAVNIYDCQRNGIPVPVLPSEITNDRWIMQHLQFLKCNSSKLKSDLLDDYKKVLFWHNVNVANGVGPRLESLLLTTVDYNTISRDMFGTNKYAKLVELYEKLFFDCRDADGVRTSSMMRLCFLAIPPDGVVNEKTPETIVWRVIAVLLDYPGLCAHWMWPVKSDDFRFSLEYHYELISRMLLPQFELGILKKSMRPYAQLQLLSLLQEDKNKVATSNDEFKRELMDQVQAVFSETFSPKLISEPITVEIAEKEDEKLRAHLRSQQQLSKQVVSNEAMEQGLNKLTNQIKTIFPNFEESKPASGG